VDKLKKDHFDTAGIKRPSVRWEINSKYDRADTQARYWFKINELIGNLKTSSNKVDQELLMFITFLNGLMDIPDIPLSLSVLGRRLGKSIMQEYELENNIKE